MEIKPYEISYLEAVVQLSLRAWESVFQSIQTSLNAEVYQAFYPETWQVSQQKAVEDVCAADDVKVWVAVETEQPIGLVAAKLHPEDRMGEIYMVAVEPSCQGRGIGRALIDHALSWMKEMGMAIVMVETGGDPGHAPARRAYESAGFELWPVARYFKSL